MNAAYDANFYERSYSTPGELYHKVYMEGLPAWAEAMNSWAVDYAIALAGLEPKRDTILDLGAGVGYFVRQWRRRGFDVIGVEISPSAVKMANDPCIVLGDIRDLSRFKEKEFAFAMSVSVLEHIALEDCGKVIAGLLRCSRAQAHVIAHEAGDDPSHINVQSPEQWACWFNAHRGAGDLVATWNALVPTMPYFMIFDKVPAALAHSLEAYSSRLLASTTQ